MNCFESLVGRIERLLAENDPQPATALAIEALEAGIAKAVAGRRVSDISHGIEQVVRKAGFSVVRQFVGHGIGRAMHEPPQVRVRIVDRGAQRRGVELREAMTQFILDLQVAIVAVFEGESYQARRAEQTGQRGRRLVGQRGAQMSHVVRSYHGVASAVMDDE